MPKYRTLFCTVLISVHILTSRVSPLFTTRTEFTQNKMSYRQPAVGLSVRLCLFFFLYVKYQGAGGKGENKRASELSLPADSSSSSSSSKQRDARKWIVFVCQEHTQLSYSSKRCCFFLSLKTTTHVRTSTCIHKYIHRHTLTHIR